ncbi:MAG: toxic anion resistance protein [Clostridia bacterium]|nr:toxic anion resistance protein [Clostridia bacterium]
MENKTPEFKLTLDPFGTQKAAEAEKTAVEIEVVEAKAEELAAMTEANLTEEEKKMVADFAGTIDITDSTQVMQYGAATQQKVADFSDGALKSVRTRDLGEVGDDLSKLVGELKTFNHDADDKGFLSLFRGAKRKVATLKARYDKVEVSVNDIVGVLEGHQTTLMKDVAVLDQLYDANLNYFKELSMYIIAGKQKLEKERTVTLPALREKAKASGLPEDAQAANDFAAMCDRFEKRIYDLELTRMVSIQMAPQIRLVQGNDTRMSEKIQSTVVNTIPLWKSQMLLTLGLAHSEEALKAEREVTDMTNDLLKKNAEKLHQSTVEIAKESERGVVDIETLTHTNQELIDTLDEVQKISVEGREKRRAAEAELARIEGEIKQKLLEIRN